jgi:DNA-binding IclR family transcriptional regulator
VLQPLLAAREALTLSALAQSAGIPAAKVHRYLVSLIRVGMVVQDAATGRYDLGPAAVRFGLASIERFDTVRYATSDLQRLRDEIDETVSLIVWAERGPTVVRTENSMHDVALTMRVGTVLPLARSASGRLFITYLPPEKAAAADLTERARKALATDARRRGCARTIGGVLPGVSGLAAPIFDDAESIVAVVSAYGRSATFDASWDGPLANAVRAFARRLSTIPRLRSN